jgi:hypothetical protein
MVSSAAPTIVGAPKVPAAIAVAPPNPPLRKLRRDTVLFVFAMINFLQLYYYL